jgi:uncharacterized membrane protein YeaQ/YmgE (transglycosylase-associated protein family)
MIRILIYLLIAFICGSIGASIAGLSRRGCLTGIALGFIGALIGGWISRKIGVPDILTVKDIPIFWSIIGSALFVAFIKLLGGGSK